MTGAAECLRVYVCVHVCVRPNYTTATYSSQWLELLFCNSVGTVQRIQRWPGRGLACLPDILPSALLSFTSFQLCISPPQSWCVQLLRRRQTFSRSFLPSHVLYSGLILFLNFFQHFTTVWCLFVSCTSIFFCVPYFLIHCFDLTYWFKLSGYLNLRKNSLLQFHVYIMHNIAIFSRYCTLGVFQFEFSVGIPHIYGGRNQFHSHKSFTLYTYFFITIFTLHKTLRSTW